MSEQDAARPTPSRRRADTTRKWTYEQFLAHADEDRPAEWVDGEIVELTPAASRHQDLVLFLGAMLRHFVEAKDLGRVFVAPFQMKTAPDLPGREPDILFVAKEHLDRVQTRHVEGPADLVVEIVSPESRARDRSEKYREYERGGVLEYWVVDPDRRQVELYHLGPDGRFHGAGPEGGVLRSRTLPGLWIEIDWLAGDGPPPMLDVLRAWKLV